MRPSFDDTLCFPLLGDVARSAGNTSPSDFAMSFTTTTYEFGVHPAGSVTDREFIVRKCPHEFCFQLHERLTRSGRIPTLGAAPLSSWGIARLAYLDSRMPTDGFRHNGQGEFQVDVNVSLGIGVVAGFLLDGDMQQVSAIGRARGFKSKQYTTEAMIEDFVQALLGSPADVAKSCCVVVDPKWSTAPDGFFSASCRDSANEYGWREGRYLGEQNVRRRLNPIRIS